MFNSKLVFYIGSIITFILTAPTMANAQAAGAAGQPPAYMNFILMAGIFGIMYVFMLRPQMKKQKDHQTFVAKLERGTEVLTTGGILGRIEGLTELYVTLEIAPDVRIKILRSAVAGLAKTANQAKGTAQGQEVKS
jgi:preprotein translocase subunit YajC